MSKIKLLQGNEACVEGALAAGVDFYAGYPITPSSEIAEDFSKKLPPLGGRFIQMEDEIASMACVIGAALAGRKALTATSGPGFSLKQEALGFGAMIEAPCVIVNVQRTGPSTGLPTSPAQGDVMQAKWGTHGDRPALALCPSSVEETYYLTIEAVNWSERFRTPVILLLDEVVGHMREKVQLPALEDLTIVDRFKPDVAPKDYLPYAVAPKMMIPPLPAYGEGYRFHTTGLFHDETGFPAAKAEITSQLIKRLLDKVEQCKEELYLYSDFMTKNADYLIISYGATARSAKAACRIAQQKGHKVGLLSLKTIWPFPYEIVQKYGRGKQKLLVAEMNMGQLIGEVERALCGEVPIKGMHKADGQLITPAEILKSLEVE